MKKVKSVETYEYTWMDGYCVGAVIYSERFRPLPDFAR